MAGAHTNFFAEKLDPAAICSKDKLIKKGLSRSNRAISACSLGDLLIIVQTRVRVGMTRCFHASIMQLLFF